MGTEALKSASITSLDTSPILALTVGEGAPGILWASNDYVTSTSGVTTGSTYKVSRIPTNAKVKRVLFSCAAHGGSAAFDIGIIHSDCTTDGTPASLQGTIPQISAADNKLFGAAVSAVSALSHSDVTRSGSYTSAHKNTPLWSVLVTLGVTTFSADPGGFFDILLKSTQTDTSGGLLEIEVDYVV